MKFRIELEEAVSIIEENSFKIEDIEEVYLEEALGRICAEDIYSPIFNPPFDKSPLDGYAVIAADTKGATREKPVTLKVVDEVFAGRYSDVMLKKGEAVRIMTGAKLPDGCNAVIRQEDTDEGMDTVEIYSELKDLSNYCFCGEDIKKDDILINAYEKLTYVHIGILSSVGFTKVKVIRKPKIALFVTGDEVQMSGEPLKEGKIYDTNLHLLRARLIALGFNVFKSMHIGDSAKKVAEEIDTVIDEVDFVLTTGGVSVGKKDIFHEVLPILGAERHFWKVDLQPGTPAMFSTYRNKPLLSLSGNPFAALATFELLGRPLLADMSCDKSIRTRRIKAVLENDFNKKSNVRRFIRAFYSDGSVKLTSNKHASGMLLSMNGCNCLIDIKAGTESLKKGDKIDIILI
ncbi:gephyrin-like molybdotransferase Glp [uncultured Clostridium sp.]|uniref:molybdopterin molybdotransferase MoeA n=1 Tax=uncultured Clostridium sp. TaxID=59620 RepID=UPI0025E54AFC|nr:gephyrin-like molybdotransferase Glp [uncultured Clostridium sp.]